MSVATLGRDKLRPMPKHGSVFTSTEARRLVRTDIPGPDGHLDSHSAPKLPVKVSATVMMMIRSDA